MKIISWSKDFKQNAIYRIDENVRMVKVSLSKSNDKTIWTKENDSLNSIGNLILHLCGNMTQYAITGLSLLSDNRNRDLEFKIEGGYTLEELLQQLIATTDLVKTAIKEASEDQLLQKYKVQGFEFSGIGLILHVVEHFSYHTGQIAFKVKLATDKSLGFYDGLDLNLNNKE